MSGHRRSDRPAAQGEPGATRQPRAQPLERRAPRSRSPEPTRSRASCALRLAARGPARRYRQRRSDHGCPADDLWAHRSRPVARPRKHGSDAGPTQHDLAGGHGPGHALGRCRLERGHQWRLACGRLTVTVTADGHLPARDHRRAAVAVVEAGGAGARCDADDVADRSSALPGLWQRLSRWRVARGAAWRVWIAGGKWRVPTGLFAVPAAIAVATGTAEGRKAAIIWNIFGLADFAVAITLGLITSPGRFQLIVPDVPNIGASDYPNVLTPAFVVPSSILLHALSLRQLVRRRASRLDVFDASSHGRTASPVPSSAGATSGGVWTNLWAAIRTIRVLRSAAAPRRCSRSEVRKPNRNTRSKTWPIRGSVGSKRLVEAPIRTACRNCRCSNVLRTQLMPSGSCGGETNDRITHRGSWTDRSGDR